MVEKDNGEKDIEIGEESVVYGDVDPEEMERGEEQDEDEEEELESKEDRL